MNVAGKVVAVTGATHGIGREIARVLCREGAAVAVSGRNAEQGEALAAQLCAEGHTAVFVQADVTRTEDCRRLIDSVCKRFGRIDGLVNNAGIYPYAKLEEVTQEEFDRVMATNVRGAYFCTQRALEYMKKTGGSIVNIGSTHWELGGADMSVYSISKGALHTLTKLVAHHYAPYGIRCNWITVGWVLSDGERERLLRSGMSEEEIARAGAERIPSGKFQTGEDIANACVFLLSDASKQVTGTDIACTGGFRTVGSVG